MLIHAFALSITMNICTTDYVRTHTEEKSFDHYSSSSITLRKQRKIRGFLSSVSIFSLSLASSFVSSEKSMHLIWDTIRRLGWLCVTVKGRRLRSRNSVTTNADHHSLSSRYHNFFVMLFLFNYNLSISGALKDLPQLRKVAMRKMVLLKIRKNRKYRENDFHGLTKPSALLINIDMYILTLYMHI